MCHSPLVSAHGAVFARTLLAALVAAAGCTETELRPPAKVFPLEIGGRPYHVEVVAHRRAVRQTVNYRRPPGPGEALLAIYPKPCRIRWNSRNVTVPLDGLFLDSRGRVLSIFTSRPLTRRDRVSSGLARALLLAPATFIRTTQLSPGSRVSLSDSVWDYARTCWADDQREQRAQRDAIGYQPPEQRWGDTAATQPAAPASTALP